MIIEAAIVIASLFAHPAPAPKATCHAGTVSYKFVGTVGTSFRYSGKQYAVPSAGSIELAGHGDSSNYQVEGKQLPLDVWPIDGFGTRTVSLPTEHADAAPTTTLTAIETSVN
ncbi:MAG: hypothetical protein ABIP63_00600 [Thermoanaerobaculia bacterium]